MKEYELAGTVGRFKPLTNSGQNLLEIVMEHTEHLIIGIGSCNRYNARNPFTAKETHEMLDRTLEHNNYSVIYVPDFAHLPNYESGRAWEQYVISAFGQLEAFFTGNVWVSELLAPYYKLIDGADYLQPEARAKWIKSTRVRYEIAKGEAWKPLVPNPVAEFLEKAGLIKRFRAEFGAEVLASTDKQYFYRAPSLEQERIAVYQS